MAMRRKAKVLARAKQGKSTVVARDNNDVTAEAIQFPLLELPRGIMTLGKTPQLDQLMAVTELKPPQETAIKTEAQLLIVSPLLKHKYAARR